MDGDDVRVTELRRSVCLPAEIRLEDLVVGEGRLQDLERDIDIEVGVPRLVDVREPSLTEELIYSVDRNAAT